VNSFEKSLWSYYISLVVGWSKLNKALLALIVSAFSYAGGTSLSHVENDAKFSTFYPTLWNLGQGWASSLDQLMKLYLRLNLRNTFDGHLLRGCWARCRPIDEKETEEKSKESSSAFTKAFRYTMSGFLIISVKNNKMSPKSKHAAGDLCVSVAKGSTTHRSPYSLVLDFKASGVRRSVITSKSHHH